MRSIELCRRAVSELNIKMLEFDFRNGPVRRKYDGLKYALRNIEDVMFELSLQQQHGNTIDDISASVRSAATDTGADAGYGLNKSASNADDEAPALKKARSAVEGMKVDVDRTTPPAPPVAAVAASTAAASFRFLDWEEIDAIRGRMEQYDQHREAVIKDCRDVQKGAKQAIFAVMRGQTADAQRKLDIAEKQARRILETIKQVCWLLSCAFLCYDRVI